MRRSLFLAFILSVLVSSPGLATPVQAQQRAYRAINSIGDAAESAANWFVPAAHVFLATLLSYRLTFYVIHGPNNR